MSMQSRWIWEHADEALVNRVYAVVQLLIQIQACRALNWSDAGDGTVTESKLRSGFCPGHSTSPTPTLPNMNFALFPGALSCWNWFVPFVPVTGNRNAAAYNDKFDEDMTVMFPKKLSALSVSTP